MGIERSFRARVGERVGGHVGGHVGSHAGGHVRAQAGGHVAARDAAARGGVWQAQAMARTLGIDLTRARHAGLLAESSARRIATACAGCRALADCMAYVAAPPTARRRAPEFCALADIFDCMVNVSGGPK